MPKCIVFTRPDGGVSICSPSRTAMSFMRNGGMRWGIPPRGFLERQIAAQAANGVGERAARRFVMAMHKGGCSSAEAYEIMRDRYCAHLGTGCELWDALDTPQDRWFRNAWRRSHNGGPVLIDLGAARRLQLDKIKQAVASRNRQRAELGRRPLVPLWGELGAAIRRARDVEELKRIWPGQL